MSLTRANVLVYTLVVLFGLSSWVSVNSVFVELPLLVESLPEKWVLPSYLSVIVQLASIGPLIVGLVERLRWKHFNAVGLIYGILGKKWKFLPQNWTYLSELALKFSSCIFLGLGCVSTVLLAFLWQPTWEIAGRQHSGALFLLFFLLSLVDCTSNVLFLPYMSRFRPQLLTVYFVGMGFSALVPSSLALMQGAGQIRCILVNSTVNISQFGNETSFVQQLMPPRFSVTVFNLLIFVFMCAALVAFFCLNTLKIAKDQLTSTQQQANESKVDGIPTEDKSLLETKTEEKVR